MKLSYLARRLKQIIKHPFYRLYERRLEAKARHWAMPHHIGIILDGNRRFARAYGLESVVDGHARGADKIREVLAWCFHYRIPIVTIWIFSLDNFNRPEEEVSGLMQLIEEKTREIMTSADIRANRVRIQYIGRTEALPEGLRTAIAETEAATAEHDQFLLNIAIAYGGREEILDAVRDCIRQQAAAGQSLDEILAGLDADAISSCLYTGEQPDPDLIIRTSGEVRLSGFLLWQSAYSEYYFCDTYWPEFRRIDFLRALRAYNLRHRRYGK